MQGLAHCQPTNHYETDMTNGTVKFFNTQKGFGFIAPANGGNDVFVHISALERSGISHLNEGQKVTYETQIDKRSGKPAVSSLELV
jgi:CspA family cold shock protein